MLAMPSVTTIGVAPAHGQGCSDLPLEPTFTCEPAQASECRLPNVIVDLTATNQVPTANNIVSRIIIANLNDLTVSVSVAATMAPLCPGEQTSWINEVTTDLVQLYNQRLAAAIAVSPFDVLDFSINLTAITLGGIALPDFNQGGATMVDPRPITVPLPVTATLEAAEPFFDEITCTFECPPPPTADNIMLAPPSYPITASLEVGTTIAGLPSGGATADINGSLTIPCRPEVGTVTCTQ